MRLAFSGCSRTGLIRPANEDAVLMRGCDAGGLFLVADGVGGRSCGEVVSGMLRDGYARWWEECFLPENRSMALSAAIDGLKAVLFQVNQTVVDRFGEMASGSTLALLFLFQDTCLYLSLGDSRIYRAGGLSLRQVTRDDICGNLEGWAGSPAGGKLASAVGIRAKPEFRLATDKLRRGGRFFLCSDGVYRFIDARKLARTVSLRARRPEQLIEDIARQVEQNGAGDNYSMIYVQADMRH